MDNNICENCKKEMEWYYLGMKLKTLQKIIPIIKKEIKWYNRFFNLDEILIQYYCEYLEKSGEVR